MSENAPPSRSTNGPVLTCRGVRKTYQQGRIEVPVLLGVDLDVDPVAAEPYPLCASENGFPDQYRRGLDGRMLGNDDGTQSVRLKDVGIVLRPHLGNRGSDRGYVAAIGK